VPKHRAHHVSTRVRKAALTRRERVAHTLGRTRGPSSRPRKSEQAAATPNEGATTTSGRGRTRAQGTASRHHAGPRGWGGMPGPGAGAVAAQGSSPGRVDAPSAPRREGLGRADVGEGRARTHRGRRGRAAPRPKQGPRGHAMAAPWPVGLRPGRGGGGKPGPVGRGGRGRRDRAKPGTRRARRAGVAEAGPRQDGRAGPNDAAQGGKEGRGEGKRREGAYREGRGRRRGAVPVGGEVEKERETSSAGKKKTCASGG
jgi:hypothetical protein